LVSVQLSIENLVSLHIGIAQHLADIAAGLVLTAAAIQSETRD
jgi:hypothetical protein